MKAFAVGEVVAGRYTLIREIGRGGSGVVYEAEHKYSGRHVALKGVAGHLAPTLEKEAVERLLREARVLGSIQSPNIVDVLDAGLSDNGTPYVVLEMLQGRTLEGILAARGRIGVEDTVAIGLDVANALAAFHARGVLHRDVKPGNIFLVREADGHVRVKLMDLGIAAWSEFGGRKLTGRNELIGTLEYMPLEQLTGDDSIDARADVYAMGVTLFECLSGRVPYEGTLADVIQQLLPSDAPSPRLIGPAIPPALVEVVERACARRRDARFASVRAFADALAGAVPATVREIHALDDPGRAAPGTDLTPNAIASRRKHPRAPYSTPVRIAAAAGPVDGRSEDISAGGMLIIATHAPEANERVSVRFALPIEGTIATLPGIVRWVRGGDRGAAKGPLAIGVEFDEPSPEITASIDRYAELMARLG